MARDATPESGSIPAWAGETWVASTIGEKKEVDPRVGGGDPAARCSGGVARGRSPRGRGRRAQVYADYIALGSIPAWAGETG